MLILAVLVVTIATGVKGQFDPLLNVESCTKEKLRVTTYGATTNGLIYIQGKGDNCRQKTKDGFAVYEFDFDECNIAWEMLLKIIIQKNAGFQTGKDKQIPIFCIPDESNIKVNNAKTTGDAANEAGLNMTVKPSAFMTFYKVVSDEEVSGQEVKLTDILIMTLQLDQQWIDDFDIKARYCIASGIVLIDNFCATDPELFPNFSKLKAGYMISQFGAFRPTNFDGGETDMKFTCVLEVCKNVCDAETCGEQLDWGRKRRKVTKDKGDDVTDKLVALPIYSQQKVVDKRAADIYDIDVDAYVKIVEKYSEIQIITNKNICMNAALFIAMIILLGVGCFTFASFSVILYRNWYREHTSCRKLTNQRSQRKASTIHNDMADVPSARRLKNPLEPRTGY